MPETFVQDCKASGEKFEALYKKNYLKMYSVKMNSFYKTNGRNVIYKHLTTMLRHVQLVYRNRPDMQMLFQLDKLLRKTKSAHAPKGNKVITKPARIFSKVEAMF